MLLCYFLFGTATSSATVLRSYFAAVSTAQDRAKAYSAFAIANVLSTIVGPLCQLIFSSIRYPGFVLIEGFLKFHIYTAPIWVATFTNIVSVTVIYCGLKDVHSTKTIGEVGNLFELENIKVWIRRVRSMNLNWLLIVLCLMERVLVFLSVVTLYVVITPFMMIAYGWDGEKTVRASSLCMAVVGILAIVIAVAFIFFRIGNKISPRCSFLLAISMAVSMYLLSYPYEITSHKMQEYNETLRTGCDPRRYSWCDTAYGTPSFILLPVLCIVMGIVLPMSGISLDTLYSKILAGIDQNVLQGAMVVAEDVSFIFGPIFVASLFAYRGLSTVWLANGLLTTFGLVCWLAFFSKMKKFE
ncbi:hypothetical protein KIN20_011100 [Parelaphostrongylus tenuis]|uniref:Uncharacterized protein n=1 Tax=Parelaphostrongylus tenuis TaxID=148309 RepID=A0AAD5M8V7_PARTN|nr:hypothetical protein KIN20_011100 [Parelaphostrongylus tenuis]